MQQAANRIVIRGEIPPFFMKKLKLIYEMLGFKLAAEVSRGRLAWPDKPRGNLFQHLSQTSPHQAHKIS